MEVQCIETPAARGRWERSKYLKVMGVQRIVVENPDASL